MSTIDDIKCCQALSEGRADMYQIIRKLIKLEDKELQRLFNTNIITKILNNYEWYEVKEKIDNRLEIGDEIILDGHRYVVIEKIVGDTIVKLYGDKNIVTMDLDSFDKKVITGRKFPEIKKAYAILQDIDFILEGKGDGICF